MLHYREFLATPAFCDHSKCQGESDGNAGKIKEQLEQTTYDSECMPDHCNDFVLRYCQKGIEKALKLPLKKLISSTEHLCSWLFENGFTISRLERFKPPKEAKK